MKRLAIIGSNDLGRLIAYHARNDGNYQLMGFFDNRKPIGENIGDYAEVVGAVDDVEKLYSQDLFDELMVGVGYTRFDFRRECFDRFFGRIPFATIVHSSSFVDKSSTLGEGVFILPGCTVDMECTIGNNVLLNTGCKLAHHVTISGHSFLAPAVSVAGYVSIGSQSFIGIGATIIDNIKICEKVVIGAGAVVTKEINEAGLYVGCPAGKANRKQ
jgi:sugar O-acyltransferase (sialic acid O-acetyltransferase NeuD family)